MRRQIHWIPEEDEWMFCRIPCGRPEQPHSWLYELPPVETGTTPPVKIIRALAGEKEKDVTPTAQERARGIVEQWCTQIDPETYLMGDDGPRLVKDLAAALEQVEWETVERWDRLAKCIRETAALLPDESGVDHVLAELETILKEKP